MKDPYDYLKKGPYPLYIDGEFVPSDSRQTMDIINPATNDVIATAFQGGENDAEKAIQAAKKAFKDGPWGQMLQVDRAQLLLKIHAILSERMEEFACLETLDAGKIYTGALGHDIPTGIGAFQYFAGKARSLEGKVVQVPGGKYLDYVFWQPRGVIGEILPWNSPFMMGCLRVAAALAAGNSVIIKTSSWASLSLLELASAFQAAGFPPGAINIITGPGATVGNYLVSSPNVDYISFTGGTETGRGIITTSANQVKDISLELGGKSPNLIFDDADLENAVTWAARAFLSHQGQICVAGTRLILQESIYDEVLEKLKKYCEELIPGNGFEAGVNFGPVISREHFHNIWAYIETGKKEGARLITGGEKYDAPDLAKGNFVPPTIFADVTPEMRIFQEEIFGPVLAVSKFKTEEEAIQLANSVKFGLASSIFTNNLKRAHQLAEKIEAGQVFINTYFSKGFCETPSRGWKESSVGEVGIYKYMHPKVVLVDLN